MNLRRIAEFISLILNPLVVLMPLPFFLVYETSGNLTSSFFWSIWSISFIFIFFILILIGMKLKLFSDLDVSKREQRPLLFAIGLILSAIYIISLYFFNAPQVLFLGIITVIVGLLILGVVNIFTKASGHLLVLSGVITFLILVEGWKTLIFITFIPILIWARVKTKNHTLKQTLIGTFLGASIISFLYVIVKYIIHV